MFGGRYCPKCNIKMKKTKVRSNDPKSAMIPKKAYQCPNCKSLIFKYQ